MSFRQLQEKDKVLYDSAVNHVIQSWEWGEFRKKTGVDLARIGHFEGDKLKMAYQITFHPVPFSKLTIGYFPKGPMPNKEMVKALYELAVEKNAAFIKLEPNIINKQGIKEKLKDLGFLESKKTLFTRFNFMVDLTKTEAEILSSMHQKTRYNIKIAQKKGVVVNESTKNSDFEDYLRLYFETTKRQKYFGHTMHYHRLLWETLSKAKIARLLIAKYNGEPVVIWMLLNFGNTLYYPYGGSSTLYKDVMASNLAAWEAIRLGKKMNLEFFDMWGALSPDASQSNPWYGFHKFKAGYGGEHVQYIGTYDLVLKPAYYNILNAADKLRWIVLRATRR